MKKFWSVFCIALLLSIVFATSAYGVISTSKTVTSSGRVLTINVGVYRDSACTQTATAIDWGNLTAGSSATYTLYVKNTGTSRETLGLSTTNWSPSTASQYITVTWNRNGAVLNAGQVVQANLTLTVSSSISSSVTTFSNRIVISGTM